MAVGRITRLAAVARRSSALWLAGAVTAQAATASSTGWRVVATAGGRQNPGLMEAIAAVARDDAWAFGAITSAATPDTYSSIVRHWNGKSWRKASLPPG